MGIPFPEDSCSACTRRKSPQKAGLAGVTEPSWGVGPALLSVKQTENKGGEGWGQLLQLENGRKERISFPILLISQGHPKLDFLFNFWLGCPILLFSVCILVSVLHRKGGNKPQIREQKEWHSKIACFPSSKALLSISTCVSSCKHFSVPCLPPPLSGIYFCRESWQPVREEIIVSDTSGCCMRKDTHHCCVKSKQLF